MGSAGGNVPCEHGASNNAFLVVWNRTRFHTTRTRAYRCRPAGRVARLRVPTTRMTTNVTSQGQVPEVDFVALQPGQAIGRYEIVSILGQGGFGITYRARDAQLDREVAIKEYLPSALAVRQDGITVLPRTTKLADDFTWGRQRFVEEGRTPASLHGAPAIGPVFDFLQANGPAYIGMQLRGGENLSDRRD